MTYPLLFKINTHIPGFFSTDEPFAALWDSWRIKYSFSNHISLRYTPLIAYPFGVDLYNAGFFAYLWMGIICILSILTNHVITYNIQVLLNFILCAFFTYLLVLYLTKNRLSAFFSGVIFAFCPYQFVRSWQHLGLTYNQWLALVLFSAFWLKEEDSKKSTLIFLASILLAFSFDWSVMYFTTVILFTFFVYFIYCDRKMLFNREDPSFIKRVRYFKKACVIIIASFFMLSVQFYPLIKRILTASAASPLAYNFYRRPFEDLFVQSAKLLSYFLPAPVHPLFGKFTEQFIGSSLYGESLTEHALYLGWVPLILSFVAFRRWRRKRKEVHKLGTVPLGMSPYHREDFYIGFFILLAIVAWFFSQPPWWKIGPIKIYMPSFFMYKILPMFRAYCRFGIMVMLAIAVLAGFGLKFVLGRFKTQKAKIAITCLFTGLVLFEFWNWPPYKVIDVSKVPAVYYWLKEQPGDFAIAEYPIDTNGANVMYMFYQTKHDKKMINGTIPGTYPNKIAKAITKLSDSKTTKVLKWMGVKYILVHREDYLKTELIEEIEELDKIPKIPGLKFIKDFPAQECPEKDIKCTQEIGPIDVYEVIAQPIKPEL